VFHVDGHPMGDWRKTWQAACRAAGVPTLVLHDCRRTAVRNLVRAGVPDKVAMAFTGHRTRSVFDRYNIVSERDIHDAAAKLAAYVAALDTYAPVVPLATARTHAAS
jgi:integrase